MGRKPVGVLQQSVAFDSPALIREPGGVTQDGWEEEYRCRAEFIYSRGSEAVQAARMQGVSVYKVKIHSTPDAQRIQSSWRMRDRERGTAYNVVEVDAITDPRWVYIVAESGRSA